MNRFDRYMIAQLTRLFGFFGLILVGIYWVNQAVALFDKLIGDGQSSRVFLEMTLLILPSMMLMVLPFAAFAAALTATNRMHGDSELTIMRGAGVSPLRLGRPVFVFGLGVFGFMLVLSHLIAPISLERFMQRQTEIARNQTASLLTPGQFTKGDKGVTVYIGDRDDSGLMSNIMIADDRNPDRRMVHTAREAHLARSGESTILVLNDGMTQILDGDNQRLSITNYAQASYDMVDLIPPIGDSRPSRRSLSSAALYRATPADQAATNSNVAQMHAAFHKRFGQPLMGLVAALLGFTPLMLGGFSRFGLRPQMGLAVIMVLVILALDGTTSSAMRVESPHFMLPYISPLAGLALAALPYLIIARPRRRLRHEVAA